jgi:NIMA (never in mitosis gene a)-related kinase
VSNTHAGTPYYLSPEIWRNRPYNSKSDVWSLGVILYEIMSLRLPFEAQTPDQLARRVLRGEYPPLPAHYSKELCSLVAKMLGMKRRLPPPPLSCSECVMLIGVCLL